LSELEGGRFTELRDIKVTDLVLSIDSEDIIRFDVSMDDRPRVEVGEAMDDIGEHLPDRGLAKLLVTGLGSGNEVLQISIACVLHDNY
jgi:hypothetical protein